MNAALLVKSLLEGEDAKAFIKRKQLGGIGNVAADLEGMGFKRDQIPIAGFAQYKAGPYYVKNQPPLYCTLAISRKKEWYHMRLGVDGSDWSWGLDAYPRSLRDVIPVMKRWVGLQTKTVPEDDDSGLDSYDRWCQRWAWLQRQLDLRSAWKARVT